MSSGNLFMRGSSTISVGIPVRRAATLHGRQPREMGGLRALPTGHSVTAGVDWLRPVVRVPECVVIAPPVVAGGKFRILSSATSGERMDFPNKAESIRELTQKYTVEYIGIDATGAPVGRLPASCARSALAA